MSGRSADDIAKTIPRIPTRQISLFHGIEVLSTLGSMQSIVLTTRLRKMHERTILVDQKQDDLDVLSGVIASQLLVSPLDTERNATISSAVLLRARQSALANRNFVTMRRERRVYSPVNATVRNHTLLQREGIRFDLIQLDPGSKLIWPAEVVAQEVLVISGSIKDSFENTFGLHELCVLRDQGDELKAGDGGARLYVRQLIEADVLPEIERAWWQNDCPKLPSQWERISDGVELKRLRVIGNVISALARVAPGAHVMDHGHNLDEDCIMLEGDLFLGDILLRPDDFHVAPADCNHVNVMSDNGALFYFHGHMPTAI